MNTVSVFEFPAAGPHVHCGVERAYVEYGSSCHATFKKLSLVEWYIGSEPKLVLQPPPATADQPVSGYFLESQLNRLLSDKHFLKPL
jgi:hypothetical protein